MEDKVVVNEPCQIKTLVAHKASFSRSIYILTPINIDDILLP
jgi:hypothetical protein